MSLVGGRRRRLERLMLDRGRPSVAAGVAVAVAGIALATLLIYPLARIAPVVSLGVVYLPVVVLLSGQWGLGLGLATALGSAIAFNFFHLPPVGTLAINDRGDWVALAAFVVIAVSTGRFAGQARLRAREAEVRRREADLSAELAGLLLGGVRVEEALPVASRRLAAAIGVPGAALELRETPSTDRRIAFAVGEAEGRVGTLVLPASLGEAERRRVAERIVPALGSILAAALHREELQAELVETAALRRSDETKTALLRSVSHDLRTPVTAILTATAALDPEHPTRENVGEVREVVMYSATRLARLIEKLLDLTMLQSGALEPRREWCSIEEVLSEAIADADPEGEVIALHVESGTPLLEGDAGQLERAFGNLLENAVRYSDGQPVFVRARQIGTRVRVRIVDQGPGIGAEEQERIFLPFYRASSGRLHEGSGLGLAIAKGFIDAGGGEITVESLPGQGTSFVVDLPLRWAADDGAATNAPELPVGEGEARIESGGRGRR